MATNTNAGIPARILTGDRSQPKLQKSAANSAGWRFAILMLTPGRVSIPAAAWQRPSGLRGMLHRPSGDAVAVQCLNASAGCLHACLGPSDYSPGSGHAAIPGTGVRAARDARTVALWSRPVDFMAALVADIARHERAAARHGDRLAVRLNGTADLPWYEFPCEREGVWFPHVFDAFPAVTFYDYTKSHRTVRAAAGVRNYSVTFSLSESNDKQAAAVLRSGGSVAVVVRGGYAALPVGPDGGRTWGGYRAVDGDKTDARFLDGDGPLVVALGIKGTAQRRGDASGFFRDPSGGLDPSRVTTFATIPPGAVSWKAISSALEDARDAAEWAARSLNIAAEWTAAREYGGPGPFAHMELMPAAQELADAFALARVAQAGGVVLTDALRVAQAATEPE